MSLCEEDKYSGSTSFIWEVVCLARNFLISWSAPFEANLLVFLEFDCFIQNQCLHPFLQVGLMLRGMGFTKNTSIFLASGKIYNSEKTMAPLREMFPNLHTKDTLASEEELAPFKVYICTLTLCYLNISLV